MESPPTAASLYVHVPFCAQKCEYCAFYSTTADGVLVNRYVDALGREIARFAARSPSPIPPKTVFFGGGTPSLLTLRQWERVLQSFEHAGWLGAAEWTVECNPATVSAEKAQLLRAFGVNRVSMGVQSVDDALLDRLGRVHSRDMVFRSFETLRQAGFDNINVDLMFGIPGQTMEVWRETLREILALGSEHLSCYEVIYEEDTPLFEQLKAGRFEVDDDLSSEMFERLVDESASAGFVQYEVANFARTQRAPSGPAVAEFGRTLPTLPVPAGVPGFACRHNVNYWQGGDYMALGPSASGYESGVRYRNVANTQLYCDAVEQGKLPRDWSEELPSLARAGEIAAFGLRMNMGWRWEAFLRATGFDLRGEWASEMLALEAKGWGVREHDGFRLTQRGLRFADDAGSEFLRTAEPLYTPTASPYVAASWQKR
ncbi:MAG: radical SAM family heme chaperone HemW [Verrucomicrobiales bacterium]|nr:radical SAM family heme chaperone HemW [Verrucomicrobiales bacterium]